MCVKSTLVMTKKKKKIFYFKWKEILHYYSTQKNSNLHFWKIQVLFRLKRYSMSNKDLEQQYHASRATSGLAPRSSALSRRRSMAQVGPEPSERQMTPVENEPPALATSNRGSSSQERPRSKSTLAWAKVCLFWT